MAKRAKLEVQIKDGEIYAPLKNKWLVDKPEERVRQEYICRLHNDYGYKLSQMAQEVKVTNSDRGQGRAYADIVVWRSEQDKLDDNHAIIVVECKAAHINLYEADRHQGYNYAAWAGAKFFVLTNGKDEEFFRVQEGKLPKRFEKIPNIPNAAIASDQNKIEKFLTQTKAFTRDEFSTLLFKCHNIIRNNDKLSPEAAFDEISKILFIKILYESDNKDKNAQIFSLAKFKEDKKTRQEWNEKYEPQKIHPDFYQYLFVQAKKRFEKDDLFEENEIIRIRENSFEAIVKELQIYNLSLTQDDVKGIAFEEFLGKTFRGELGQFFTPRTIVDFMTEVLDPQEDELMCDPCCGSGGFLIKAFEYIREQIENDIYLAKDELIAQYRNEEYEKASAAEQRQIDADLNAALALLERELNTKHEQSRMHKLSSSCIFGTDANPRMSRTAKMNMIMHGDGHGGVHHNDGLLNVNGIFTNRFDVILTNPPFGSRIERSLIVSNADKYTNLERIKKYQAEYGKDLYNQEMAQVTKNIGKPILDLYETGSMSSLTEVLFIERCLNLLKAGGRMGIVLPEGVLNNTNLQKVREYVESRAKILLICSIPQDVFMASGATVKPSLLFLKKFDEKEQAQYQAILQQARIEINAKHAFEKEALELKLDELNAQKIAKDLSAEEKAQKRLELKEQKKAIKEQLKELEELIQTEVKAQVKEEFNYFAPIAEVEKAGISTTGGVIENELKPLAIEFKQYRQENNLWAKVDKKVSYERIKNAANDAANNDEENEQTQVIKRTFFIDGVQVKADFLQELKQDEDD